MLRRGSGDRAGDPLDVRDRKRGALTVGDGELVVLLGASGQGKTQWVRSLVGLGDGFERCHAFGAALTKDRVPEVLSLVPQNDGVFLSDTVWDNVYAPRHVAPCQRSHAVDALDLVGLSERAAEPVANLGVGARRRVALARAVARRRPVLVVDGELDPVIWGFWSSLLGQMSWLRGVLVTASTADPVAWRADSAALIDDGVVVGQGPLSELAASRDPQVKAVMAWVTP
ncbi:ATP-binding cassette domain-containing protein [Acidiferrimicrobium sp. IK]|uniref:ATP-binding cassette domain-containing protein n=1 Tax=Acidiferrimicrobium sp. IK TaxID=2871700 RepID=UPI0021CB4AA6|nr:ATP-binding cassette domain-containing protein [Acidiferrimicrobium sp. IK]MCU4184412.1 ATP-binding cassette domain-containing protein [Acidiferrimicrobium sp. IK]